MSLSPDAKFEFPGSELHGKLDKLCTLVGAGILAMEPNIGEACSVMAIMIARVTSQLPENEFEAIVQALPTMILENRKIIQVQKFMMTEVQGNG